jgi:hypothetical protein
MGNRNIGKGVLVLYMLFWSSVHAASYHTLSANEILRFSRVIVVAQITNSSTRLGGPNNNLVVTDYQLEIEQALHGDWNGTRTLTVGGGAHQGIVDAISGNTHLDVGRVYLLFIEDPEREIFNPLVGSGQGSAVRQADGSYSALAPSPVDNELRRATGGGMLTSAAGEFDEYVALWETRINEKREILGKRPNPPRKRPGRDLPAKEPELSPMRDPAILPSSDSPAMPESIEMPTLIEGGPATDHSVEPDQPRQSDVVQPAAFRYYVSQRAVIPVVFNQLPDDWHWSPHDQYMMSRWNRYGGEVYRVRTEPTGTWGYPNGRFDIGGWPSDADMVSVFGEPWSPTTLGATFSRSQSGTIIEADILLNPAFDWTLDNELASRGRSTPYSFENTMLHELGHAWGLRHPWEHQDVWWDSVMNYPPKKYRIPRLRPDDTEAVRAVYGGAAIRDALISLYWTDDRPQSQHASYQDIGLPDKRVHGDLIWTRDLFTISNVGTVEIEANPQIHLYLTEGRMSFSRPYFLGTESVSCPSLQQFSSCYVGGLTASVSDSVPVGDLYLAAMLEGDDWNGNNAFWSWEPIRISNVLREIYPASDWSSEDTEGAVASSGQWVVTLNAKWSLDYTFSTCPEAGGSANFDTVIEVEEVPSGRLITEQDDFCGLQSSLQNWHPENDAQVLVRLRGYSRFSTGDFRMMYRVQESSRVFKSDFE